jgi:hypothetical protein
VVYRGSAGNAGNTTSSSRGINTGRGAVVNDGRGAAVNAGAPLDVLTNAGTVAGDDDDGEGKPAFANDGDEEVAPLIPIVAAAIAC